MKLKYKKAPKNKGVIPVPIFGFGSQNEGGFTLIELLVVISIIAFIASVALTATLSARIASRDAKRLAEIKQLAAAMELFYSTYGSFPTTTLVTAASYGVLSVGSPCSPSTFGCVNYLVPAVMNKMPTSPIPADGNCGANYLGATGNDYQYAGTGINVMTINTYTITFCLGLQVGGLPGGIHTLTPLGIR